MVGIAEMGEISALKQVGIRTLVYTVIVSSIAVVLSLTAVNVLRPGDGVDPVAAQELLAQGGEGAASIVAASAESDAGVNQVIAIVPSNVISAMSNNDILAVMFFALFFGIGLLLVKTPRTAVLKDAVEGVFEVAMRLIGIVIQLAPIAIFCSGECSRPASALRFQRASRNGVISMTSSGLSDMNQVIGIVSPATARSTPLPAQKATVLPICS